MTTLPLFANQTEPESERSIFGLSFEYTQTPREGDLPLTSVLFRVLVDGRQIGLISCLDIKVRSDEVYPQVLIRIGEGLTPEMVKGCSKDLKATALLYIEELRRFPFIAIESPFLNELETRDITIR